MPEGHDKDKSVPSDDTNTPTTGDPHDSDEEVDEIPSIMTKENDFSSTMDVDSLLAEISAEDRQQLIEEWQIALQQDFIPLNDFIRNLITSVKTQREAAIQLTLRRAKTDSRKSFVDWNANTTARDLKKDLASAGESSISNPDRRALDKEDEALLATLGTTDLDTDVFMDFMSGTAPYPGPPQSGVRERKVTTDLPLFTSDHPNPRRWFRDMREDCEDANKFEERAVRPIIRHMDDDSRTRIDLSVFANGGLPKGVTLEQFGLWFVATFSGDEKHSEAKQEALQYNPTGKSVRTMLSDLFAIFLRCGSMLKQSEACLIIRSKCPKDVLGQIKISVAKDLRQLCRAILEAENWLYPRRTRLITKDQFDWSGIPALDPKLKPVSGNSNSGNSNAKSSNKVTKFDGKPDGTDSTKLTCTFCQRPGHKEEHCRFRKKAMKAIQPTKTNTDKDKNTFATDAKCAYCKGNHVTWKCDKRRKAFATEMATAIRASFATITTPASPPPSSSASNSVTPPLSSPSSNAAAPPSENQDKDDLAERLQFAMQRCMFATTRFLYGTDRSRTVIRKAYLNKNVINMGIDSWSSDSFIHSTLASLLELEMIPCSVPFNTMNGEVTIKRRLKHPLSITLGDHLITCDEVYVSDNCPTDFLISFHELEKRGWDITPPPIAA